MKETLKHLQSNNNGDFPFNYLYLNKTIINVENKKRLTVRSNKHNTDSYPVKSFYKPFSSIY